MRMKTDPLRVSKRPRLCSRGGFCHVTTAMMACHLEQEFNNG